MAKIMPAHVPVHIEPVQVVADAVLKSSEHTAESPKAAPTAIDHYVDTYVARSVKSSPNGF